MNESKHSIRLHGKSCYGCTVCIKRCPTEAIRIRDGKSVILPEKCIDCGECVRACPSNAKYCETNKLEDINVYPIRVALVSPMLYGQFDDLMDIDIALDAVASLGFDEVYETALGAEIYAESAKEYIDKNEGKVISSSCPAVIRLIQMYFPDLLENIIPLKTPEEITAELAKAEVMEKYGVKAEDVGIFLITTCPAQLTNVRHPLGFDNSEIDGVLSLLDVFAALKKYISSNPEKQGHRSVASPEGLNWFNVRGQAKALHQNDKLVVDEIHNVYEALEQFENNKFPGLSFVEALACKTGCAGGALGFENCYVTKSRLEHFIEGFEKTGKETRDLSDQTGFDQWKYAQELPEIDVVHLDADMGVALEKYKEIEEITAELPGLDCGACGSPTCKALAEDIVQGEGSEFDCIFIMRTKLNLANREEEEEE